MWGVERERKGRGRDREYGERDILTQSWSACSSVCKRQRTWKQARCSAGTDEDCPWVWFQSYIWCVSVSEGVCMPM